MEEISEVDIKKEKKSKKSKKNKHKDSSSNVDDEVVETVIEEKEEKKKRKHSETDVIVNNDEDDNNEVKKDKKKKKKNKHVEVEEEVVIDFTNKSSIPIKSNKHENSNGNYIIDSTVQQMSLNDVQSYRTELGIAVYPEEDSNLFKPLTNFTQIYPSLGNNCNEVVNYIKRKSFVKPSPIQSQCWPPLLSNRDVIGIAATGSGT